MVTHPRPFAIPHRWDRNFFLAFVLLALLGVGQGFFPASAARFAGKSDYAAPLILQIHAASFLAWMLLLTVQIGLIRWGRQRNHRKLGVIGACLIPVMILSGFFSEVYSQRFYLTHPPNSQAFFIIPIWYVLAFGILAGLAIAKRTDPPAHKRLIYLATTVIVGAAYTRWWGEGIKSLYGDGYFGLIANTFTSTNLFMAALVAYDFATRGRIHPTVMVAVPAIVASEFMISWLYHAPGWLPVAHAIAAALPGPPIP